MEHLRPSPDQEPSRRGLCATCHHARRIVSQRGSHFLLCQLALTNPAYRKYPHLPVLRCDGYRQKDLASP